MSLDYLARIERLQQKLIEKHYSAMLVSNGYNVQYLTGFVGVDAREREAFLIVRPDSAELIMPQMYHSEAGKLSYLNYHVLQPNQSFLNLIQSLLKQESNVVFEADDLQFYLYQHLQQALPGVKLEPSTNLIKQMRAIKDAQELELIGRAASLTDQTLAEAVKLVSQQKMSEKQLAFKLHEIMLSLGADKPAFPPLVAVGPHTANPHHLPTDQLIEPGQPILIDIGAVYQGYAADLTRMLVKGKPDAYFVTIYDTVHQSLMAAMQAVQPGMLASDLYQLSLEQLGKYADKFLHSLGHGVGLQIHELPSLSARYQQPLHANQVITLEPGIYLPDKFGVRLENLGMVTKQGWQDLTTTSLELIKI